MSTLTDVLDATVGVTPAATESPIEQALDMVQTPEPPQDAPPPQEEVVEQAPVEEAVVEDENEVIEQPTFDFTELEQFGIKSVDDVKAMKDNLESYKQQAETKFADEKIKELNDYVLNGGDMKKYVEAEKEIANYEEYHAQLDTVDPVEAYKANLKNLQLTDEEVEEIMDTMTDAQKKLEGKKIIAQEKLAVSQVINEKKSALTVQTQQQAERQSKVKDVVSSAIDKLEAVTNVKVSAKDREVLKQYAPNDLIRKYFPLDEGGLPKADVWAKSAAILEFAERNAKILQQKVATQTKKQEFDKLHNVKQPIQQEAVREQKASKHATMEDIMALRG